MKKLTALIDGDWILYAAGFAGQRNELVCPERTQGTTFPTITAIKEALDGDYQDEPVYSRVVVDPVEHILHTAKNMINAALDRIEEKHGCLVEARVMIDGDGNFRSQLASIAPYKGTRHVHAKPHAYNDIRQYLLDTWQADVIHGQETDDAMAIAATNDPEGTIMVTLDKDLLQVPGYHYNPNKGFRKVTPEAANLFLWRQAAMGDSTDNIKGIYKMGPKGAEKLFPDGQPYGWPKLVEAYENSIAKHGDNYNGLTAEEAALENMRLVYLRRQEGELWMPPGV